MSATTLSPHFRRSEFDSHDGHAVPRGAVDDVARWCTWWGEPFRAEFGRTTILSGYRSPAQNRMVGGASRSVHMLGTAMPGRAAGSDALAAAADVRAARGGPLDWHRWAIEHRRRYPNLGARGRGGIGRYVVQGFIHLDTGVSRDWNG